jgi:hypothetical protein
MIDVPRGLGFDKLAFEAAADSLKDMSDGGGMMNGAKAAAIGRRRSARLPSH